MKMVTAIKLIWGSFIRKEEFLQYLLAERICAMIYPTYKFSEFGKSYLQDTEFLNYYESFVGKKNYHSLDRKYTLSQLVKLADDVDGDTVECGVFMGASSFLICRHISGQKKIHHIFDSFAGLSQPDLDDGAWWTQGALACSEETVKRNLQAFDFVEYHKGWIPDRFMDVQSSRFSFIHLDVDLYQPTYDSLEFFYPRLNPGGIIVCDDYGFSTCPGAQKAMDTFFSSRPEKIISLPTGAFTIKK